MAGLSPVFFARLTVAASVLTGFMTPASGQTAEPAALPAAEHPTPFSVWLDLRPHSRRPASWPIWIESTETHDQLDVDLQPVGHTVRIRFRRFAALHKYMLVRLQFRDTPMLSPVLTAWSETGGQAYDSGSLGTGQGLTRTERLILPMADVDYLEIQVPGDGRDLRAVQLVSMNVRPVLAPLDFADRAPVYADPFTAPEEKGRDSAGDENLLGRVRAMLLEGEATIRPEEGGAALEFEIEGPPLLAVAHLQILNADPLRPLQAVLNRTPLGKLALNLPDLADPAYRGVARPLQPRMAVRYSGWMSAEIVLPSELLRAGKNTLIFQPDPNDQPVAIRAVELQMKYNDPSFDYDLAPNKLP